MPPQLVEFTAKLLFLFTALVLLCLRPLKTYSCTAEIFVKDGNPSKEVVVKL